MAEASNDRPSAGPGPPATYPVRAACCTAAAALLVLFLRRPESFLNPQLFAEDSRVFFLDAARNPWGSLTAPYAGYMHLFARLVAALCSHLDMLLIPAAYFAVSIAAVAALVLALFSRRVDLPHPWLFALGVVLVPHTGEVFDNLTNLQWITALGLVVLLLARDPASPAQWAVDFAYAAVISLSGVFSIVLAPLFAARAAVRRTGASIGLACLVLAGAAIQANEVIHFPFPTAPNDTTPLLALATFGQRVWLGLFLTPALANASPLPARAAAGVLGLALLAALCVGTGGARAARILAAACLLLVAAAIYRYRGEILILDTVGNGDRYFFVPKVCAIWILLLGLLRAPAPRWLCGVLLAALLANTCLTFRFERWNDYHWAYWVGQMRTEERVVVPVNPAGFTFTYERPRPGP